MNALTRAARRARALDPRVGDSLLALLIAGLGLAALGVTEPTPGIVFKDPDVWAVLLTLGQSLPLAARRRHPLAVLLAVTAATAIASAAGYLPAAGSLSVLVAVYTVVSLARPAEVAVGVGTALAGLGFFIATGPGPTYAVDVVASTAVLLGAAVLGYSVRTRRAYVASLEERAARLEEERDRRARDAVAEERARIARELHDVVAHGVSVMTVQAGAARRVLDADPEAARGAIRAVESTGRAALDDLRRLLGVLREGDEATDARAPQPSLRELGALLGEVRAAGLPVDHVVEGEPRPLPAGVDLSAYRIVQEALTNARRHAGPARARLVLRYGEDDLVVEVSDDGRGAAASLGAAPGQAGHGLVGMRERAALFGGTLDAGPAPGGGWHVRARLPVAERGAR